MEQPRSPLGDDAPACVPEARGVRKEKRALRRVMKEALLVQEHARTACSCGQQVKHALPSSRGARGSPCSVRKTGCSSPRCCRLICVHEPASASLHADVTHATGRYASRPRVTAPPAAAWGACRLAPLTDIWGKAARRLPAASTSPIMSTSMGSCCSCPSSRSVETWRRVVAAVTAAIGWKAVSSSRRVRGASRWIPSSDSYVGSASCCQPVPSCRCSSRNRRYLRCRQIKRTIPERRDQQALPVNAVEAKAAGPLDPTKPAAPAGAKSND